MLHNLRPAKATDLGALSQMLDGQPVQLLLPSRLSDEILLSLALDLRRLEAMQFGGVDAGDSLSVVLYVALKFLAHFSPNHPNHPNDRREFSEESVFEATQILGFAIEREIVTRLVGVSDGRGDEVFLDTLKRLSA